MNEPTTVDRLATLGLGGAASNPTVESAARFPDGAQFRVEIPSVEGPRCLAAVLAAAEQMDVPVTRVSQGSGVSMLTDAEITQMVRLAAGAGIEISLFARPCAGWDTSAMARAAAGGGLAAATRGPQQLVAVIDEIRRAADLGIRSVLIADIGVLSVFSQLRSTGVLPADMQAKVSVMLPVANPATARLITDLGADTVNLPTDLTVDQIAAIRGVTSVPVDIYIESPDSLGGFMRYHELARIIEVAAPVYAKFGLRNAPDIYPSGSHLDDIAVGLTRERVRRARLGLDLLARSDATAICSAPGAQGLAIPVA